MAESRLAHHVRGLRQGRAPQALRVHAQGPTLRGSSSLVRRGQLVGVRKPFGHLVPIMTVVEVDADPPAHADVRWAKVSRGRAREQQILSDVSGFAPDRMTASAVMIVCAREAREHLLSGPEGRLAMRYLLPCAGERKAQPAQASEWAPHASECTAGGVGWPVDTPCDLLYKTNTLINPLV